MRHLHHRAFGPKLLLRVIARAVESGTLMQRNKKDREAIVSAKRRLAKPWTLSGVQPEHPQPWATTPVSVARSAPTRRALDPAARTRIPAQAVHLDLDDMADLYGDFA